MTANPLCCARPSALVRVASRSVLARPGKLKPADYDKAVGDLVGFLKFVGEPAAESRKTIGVFVLIALALLTILSYLLKKNYWKDIH